MTKNGHYPLFFCFFLRRSEYSVQKGTKMADNKGMAKAKSGKKDEFYTIYEEIQSELNHYEKHFSGKVVFCNCDDPYESNFFQFFVRNFNYLKLKRLICTSYRFSKVVG